MKVIYKYDLELKERQTIRIPKDFCPIKVDYQSSVFGKGLKLWAVVNTDTQEEEVTVLMCPTGIELPAEFYQVSDLREIMEGAFEDCPIFPISTVIFPPDTPMAGEVYHSFIMMPV